VDPARGGSALALFVLLIGGALALFAWRTARIGLGGSFELLSRELGLLANNVLSLSPRLGDAARSTRGARRARRRQDLGRPAVLEAVFVP